MDLYLMRHGKYRDASIDPKEGLSSEGKKESQFVAQTLKQMYVHPDMILSSTKTRAIETACIVAEQLHYPIDQIHAIDQLLPKADPEDCFNKLFTYAYSSLFCVSHLPLLEDLVDFLCGERVSFAPATVAYISLNEGNRELIWIKHYQNPLYK